MGYCCSRCGGLGGLFESSHLHSDPNSCFAELVEEKKRLLFQIEQMKKSESDLLTKKFDLETEVTSMANRATTVEQLYRELMDASYEMTLCVDDSEVGTRGRKAKYALLALVSKGVASYGYPEKRT